MDIEPLSIWDGISTKRTLNAVEGAALFLRNRWPANHVSRLASVAAPTAALHALEGSISADAFRVAFIAAAHEADMLAPDDRPGSDLPDMSPKLLDFPKKQKQARR